MRKILLIVALTAACGPKADKKQLETILGLKTNVVSVTAYRIPASIPPLVAPVKIEPKDDEGCGVIVENWEQDDNGEFIDKKVDAKEIRDEVVSLRRQLKDAKDSIEYFTKANEEYFGEIQSIQTNNTRLKEEIQSLLVKASGK